MDKKQLKFIDMFAGIGGFRSGMMQAGMKPVGYIEWDKFARKCYQAMYDTTNEFTASDIQKVKGTDLPDADLWSFGSPCFTKDAIVQTNENFKPIKEVNKGDMVLSIDHKYHMVVDKMIHFTKDIYDLKASGNFELHVTGNHPILVRKRRNRHVGHSFDDPKWIPVKNIKHGDLVCVALPNDKINHKAITDEEAWLLGRYVADGCILNTKIISRPNEYYHRVIFAIGENKANYFIKHFKKYNYTVEGTYNNAIHYEINNEPFMNLAKEFGQGAINKHIPSWVFALSQKQRELFIDGYTSGDGSRIKTKTGIMQSVTSISKKLVLGLAQLVELTYKIPASVYYFKCANTHIIEGRVVNQHDQYSVHYKEPNQNTDYYRYSKLIDDNLWKPVYKIKHRILEKPVQVYNLEVEGTHTYNVNGIICKNCTDISVAGRQEGLVKGKQSSMFFEVIRLAKERIEAKKSLPRYLWLENVKNLLSSNRGRDFARVLIEMDKIGYDVEWSVIDSARFVPQHRERIYVIGHLREDGKCSKQIFPLGRENADFAQTSKIKVVANDSKTGYRSHDVVDETGISKTIDATSYKHKPLVRVKQLGNYRLTKSFGGNPQTGRVYDKEGLSPTLNTMQGGDRQPKILDKIKVRPTLTPERVNKRQMGRRFKQDGEPSFTLTAEDRHGVMLEDDTQEPTKYVIRKLTPRECWRLQGFTDEQFDKAQQAGVSDSQLYARAGNAVTVPVIKAIADKIVASQ